MYKTTIVNSRDREALRQTIMGTTTPNGYGEPTSWPIVTRSGTIKIHYRKMNSCMTIERQQGLYRNCPKLGDE